MFRKRLEELGAISLTEFWRLVYVEMFDEIMDYIWDAGTCKPPLDAAYQRFFKKKGGHPRFKSRRHSRMSYTTNFTNGNIAVLYEYQTEVTPQAVRSKRIIGLDYKSDGLYMDSSGVCCGMPHFFRKSQEKLTKAQRKLKTKQLHSANYRKQ